MKEDEFNWGIVELFVKITRNYLDKLIAEKGMKIEGNDSPDWVNTLYVLPGEQYLTFDRRWKKLILNDTSIMHYYYVK